MKVNRGAMLAVVLILLVSFSITYMRNIKRVSNMTRIRSTDGVYDLTKVNLEEGIVRLEGDVSYIPGILSPEEFSKREQEAEIGNPWYLSSATSRIRLLVPEDCTYTLTAGSIDFAHRAYVNGELRFEAGTPALQKEDFEAGFAQMTLDVKAENGVIEILQQGANFVHKEGGGHSNLYFGNTVDIHKLLARTQGCEYILVGLFTTLFLVHLILYMIRRSYRANLTFSLLCATWMLRTGITGAKVFYALFPNLSWEAALRLEYLSMPLAMMLLLSLIKEVFPVIPQRWFQRIGLAGAGIFAFLCMFIDTRTLSYTLFYFELFFTLAIVYLCIRFCWKLPKMWREHSLLTEHILSLIGLSIFMVASINDAFYHAGVYHAVGIPLTLSMTGPAMLIFSMLEMSAMFYGTMRETLQAHEREQKAEAEKQMLVEMNRFKGAFYADLSHEMKTPLTVIAVNAQFAAQNLHAGAIDEETIADLNAISIEAKRLAQMVTSLVDIGRMQGMEKDYRELDMTNLISETLRIYQTLFDRKHTILTSYIEPALPAIYGNADQMIQVFINLLSNANRHTNKGLVHVEAIRDEQVIHIIVKDNGCGIAKEFLPHVFERYYHGEDGGSGLGLSICKTIVEEHGGSITIESEEGSGTSVSFTLPIIKEEQACRI